MVSTSSSGQTIRRVVDGASLVVLEALKRFVPSDQPSVAVLSQSLKTIALSATDLLGVTSGRVHRYSSRPSSSSSSSVSSPPNTTSTSFSTSSSSSSSSVVYFSNHENENGNKNEHTQEPIPTPAAAADGSSRRKIVDCNLDDSPSLKDKYDKSLGFATVAVVREDDEGEEGKENKNKKNIKNKEEVLSLLPMKDRRRPRERRVPSTPIGRAFGFAGLGAGLAWGTIQESTRRFVFGSPNSEDKHSALSPFLSEQNAERLALALCRMRGAALKLGQMLSIQDESLIPAPILSALDVVRQGADVMPRSQLNDVLDAELGPNWSKKLKSFDYEPLAAASIGQVHHAVMMDGMGVAMKIQYPGVADSIDSDIENVRRLLDYTNVIPKGLFLDRAIKVAKEELSRECDYELEAKSQKRFRELLSSTEGVYVPMVINEISSRRVLTTELVTGIPVDKVSALNQETRNYVGRKLLEVTLKELFVFRFMQTDPNWSNFLFNEATKTINLIDFGAAREYHKGFVDDYLRMVLACANRDRDAVIEMSTRLGFLTGMESEIMLDAHVQASFIVGLPFSTSDAYDFRSSNITSSISHLGSTMLKHRLTPPPDEAYSLHRKLSGAFLACIKLGGVVPCRDLLLQVYQQYHFSDENEETAVAS